MRKTLIAIGFLTASAFTGAAAAQGFGQVAIQAAPPEAPAKAATPVAGVTVDGKKTAEKGKDPDEIICRSTTPIGSRFPVKTCARRGDLAAQTAEGQTTTRQMTTLRPGSGN